MSYYTRVDERRFLPTEHATGAWNDGEVHMAPLSGLLVHEIEQHRGPGELVLSRVSFDILGFLGTAECEIRVETVRPGRTIELIEATASIAGLDVVRARAWYLASFDTAAVKGGEPGRLPSPESLPSIDITGRWPGGFIRSLDVRVVSAPEPGRATGWLRGDDLLDGEAIGSVASFISLVDTANGIAARESPREWTWPNVDLSIHLWRQPIGRWVGLDTTVTWGPTGQGVTSTVLHDESGAVGFAHQSLTVRPAAL